MSDTCTSFFGMNVEGIRDMEQSQYIFWIVAVPVTCVVIELSLAYAYRWEKRVQASKRRLGRAGPAQPDRIAAAEKQSRWEAWYAHVSRQKTNAGDRDFELGISMTPGRQQTGFSLADDNFGLARKPSWWPRRD